MSDDVYEVHAVRYGHHDRRSPENFLGGDPHDILQPLDFYVWAIVNEARTFVVDTGFDAAMAQRRKRDLIKPVGEGLQALGINAESVESIIVTHLHYDHTGNYNLFPRARYHLQDVEMACATGRCMCHAHLRMPFEADDVVAMVRKVSSGSMPIRSGATAECCLIRVHMTFARGEKRWRDKKVKRVETARNPGSAAGQGNDGTKDAPGDYPARGHATENHFMGNQNQQNPGRDRDQQPGQDPRRQDQHSGQNPQKPGQQQGGQNPQKQPGQQHGQDPHNRPQR